MKLEKVFTLGHTVATCRNPTQHVVRHRGSALWREGYYLLEGEALAVVAARGSCFPEDFAAGVGDEDAAAFDWAPDADHCWCEGCAGARRAQRTQLPEA